MRQSRTGDVPGSSVLGGPRSSVYRDVGVQASTSRLSEPTPLTVYRAVPQVPPPLGSSMVDTPIRVHGVRAHDQFCLPKMTLLYIQTLSLLPEEGSELDI